MTNRKVYKIVGFSDCEPIMLSAWTYSKCKVNQYPPRGSDYRMMYSPTVNLNSPTDLRASQSLKLNHVTRFLLQSHKLVKIMKCIIYALPRENEEKYGSSTKNKRYLIDRAVFFFFSKAREYTRYMSRLLNSWKI